jgi:hypothetical protein
MNTDWLVVGAVLALVQTAAGLVVWFEPTAARKLCKVLIRRANCLTMAQEAYRAEYKSYREDDNIIMVHQVKE